MERITVVVVIVQPPPPPRKPEQPGKTIWQIVLKVVRWLVGLLG